MQVLEKEIQSVQDIAIGQIFYSSWGYDQTNIDFYKVIRKTAKTIELQQIGQQYVEATSSLSEYVTADPDKILYDYEWVDPSNEYYVKKVSGKGWEVAPNQGDEWGFGSEWSSKPRWADHSVIEDAVLYRKAKISKHVVKFSGSEPYVRITSYAHASLWNGQKLHQSHWA